MNYKQNSIKRGALFA